MSEQNQGQLIKIGFFTIVAFAIFVLALLVVGRKTGYFASYYQLVGEFQTVQGLDVGQPVWVSGVDVGLVKSIRLSPETKGAVRVFMTVETKYQEFIREDSVALLSTKGLLGDKIVNITMGSPVSAVLQDGAQIQTEEPMELGDVVEQVGGVLGSLEVSLGKVEEVVAGMAEGEGTIGKLVRDDELHNQTVSFLNNLNVTLENINKAEGTLGKLIVDDALYQDIEGIVGKINRGEGTLGKLLTSEEIHTNLVEASASVDKLFATAATGEGSVGKMMMEEDLHDSVVELLQDIKENPSRYVNVTVFGGRKNKK